jgi:hypothetical protein
MLIGLRHCSHSSSAKKGADDFPPRASKSTARRHKPLKVRATIVERATQWVGEAGNFFGGQSVLTAREDVMKTYFANLPMKIWLLIAVPAVLIAYPVTCIVVPAVLHAVVPEVVRSVLSMI